MMPIPKEELDHMAGEGCIVTYQYGYETTTNILDASSLENEVWQEAAFTNGPPLVKITIEFAPEKAKKLVAQQARSK
jgi:hypothetical protein